MAILICGGAGYIGSHINKLLSSSGYETVIFDNLSTGHREAVKWGSFEKGDLANPDEIRRVFSKYNINAVMDFAACAYVGESVVEPEKYYYNNVVNPLNLFRVMREYECSRIVFSSSCATYGCPADMPITEGTQQLPINPYGRTKLIIEQTLEDYSKAYGMRYVALRYFNAAGADESGEIGESHDPETHLIPLVLDAASGVRGCIKVYGTDYPTEDGSCVRDYIHVTDLAAAHLLALNYLEQGNASACFNLGSESGFSVLNIINSVKNVTGKDFRVVYADRRPGDPPKLVGSSDKAKKILKWNPEHSDIETIINDAWRWHEHKLY